MKNRPEPGNSLSGRSERRRYARYPLAEAHEVSFGSGPVKCRGVLLNLCEAGMAVHTEAPPEPGSIQRLRWKLRQQAEPPGTRGAIMRMDKESGAFKVEFPDLSEHVEHLEAEGVVIWVDNENQRFGIRFHNLPKQVEQSIFRWALHHELPPSESCLPEPRESSQLTLSAHTASGQRGGAIVPIMPPVLSHARRGPRPWSVAAIVALAGLAFLGGGAYWEAHAKSADGMPSAGAPILRLAGSNTIGATLAPALAQAFLKQLGAKDIQVLPGASADEESVQAVLPGFLSAGGTRVEIQIAAHGSATAFDDLMNGSCDIGMASRKIKPKEISKLSAQGDWSSPASEHLLALDGIAVIVSSSNPLPMLTKDQLARIFSGSVVDWSEVSAQHGAINLYAPDNKSGTYDTFKAMVLGSRPLAANTRRLEDSRAISDAVAGDRNGIGFVGLPYVLNAKAIAVGESGAISLQPNRLTVGTEDYLLSRRLYLYTPADPQNKYVRKFVDFALSNAGQEVVGDVGFIAQNVTSVQDVSSPTASPQYRRLTQNAGRLSLDFRFLPGLTVLDSKAQSDLARVVSFLADSGYSGDSIMLLGFTDNTGDRQANIAISQRRARIVAEEFAQRGLRPATIKGFGSDLPLASNDNDSGRERNRRVEIWLKEAQCVAPRNVRDPG